MRKQIAGAEVDWFFSCILVVFAWQLAVSVYVTCRIFKTGAFDRTAKVMLVSSSLFWCCALAAPFAYAGGWNGGDLMGRLARAWWDLVFLFPTAPLAVAAIALAAFCEPCEIQGFFLYWLLFFLSPMWFLLLFGPSF